MLPRSVAARCHSHLWTLKKQKLDSTYFKQDFKILSAIRGKIVTTIGNGGAGVGQSVSSLMDFPSSALHPEREKSEYKSTSCLDSRLKHIVFLSNYRAEPPHEALLSRGPVQAAANGS